MTIYHISLEVNFNEHITKIASDSMFKLGESQ